MAQVQYNLSDFERREPRIRVARPTPAAQKHRRKMNLAPLRAALTGAVLLALTVSLLLFNAQATALAGEVSARQTRLTELKGEYDYLEQALESRISLAYVEEKAVEMGLIRATAEQYVYVTLQDDNAIEVQNETLPLFSTVKEWWNALVEYIAPQ